MQDFLMHTSIRSRTESAGFLIAPQWNEGLSDQAKDRQDQSRRRHAGR